MSEEEVQNLPSTVALLGLKNPAKTVNVDGKLKKEAEAEQKRAAAAQLKQAKLKSARNIHKAAKIYKPAFLLKHLVPATCGLSKTPLQKYRGTAIATELKNPFACYWLCSDKMMVRQNHVYGKANAFLEISF